MITFLLFAACAKHPSNVESSEAPVKDAAPTEDDARRACAAGQAEACLYLVQMLEPDATDPGRIREALDAVTPLAQGDTTGALVALLVAETHPSVSRPEERAAAWRTLCDQHQMSAACEVGGWALAEESPTDAAALWTKGCALGLHQLCPPAAPSALVPVALPEDFAAELRAVDASFHMPVGFHPIPVAESPDFQTEFAILSDDGRLEMRFAVRDDIAVYNQLADCKDQPGCVGATFMSVETSQALVALANVGHVTPDKISVGGYPPLPVRVEFNANWGMVGSIPANPGFSADEAMTVVSVLHRDPAANLYIFTIVHDLSAMNDLQQEAFHALRFAQPVGLGGSWLPQD